MIVYAPGLTVQVIDKVTAQINVALASNGGVASASSQVNANFPVASIINGDRRGLNWGAGGGGQGGGWNDGTLNAWPDWVQVVFAGPRTIDHVVVYTLQDAYNAPVEPTDTMTFAQYGVTAFNVQVWNGTAWVTVGTVTGNNLVKRTVSFSSVSTDRIRINATAGLGGYSRIVEVEAWGN